MLQILLTGATGFLGSRLVARMASLPEAYKVTALKRTSSNTWRIAHLLESVETENIDLDDLARQAAQIPSRGLLSGSSKVRLAMCLRIQMFTTLLQLFR